MRLSGRRAKPLEEKELEGFPGDNPVPIAPKKAGEIGACPKGEQPEVRAIWEQCRKDWDLILCPQDRKMLLVFCRTAAACDRAWERYWKAGEIDASGNARAFPSAEGTRYLALVAQLTTLASHFGATPATRSKVAERHLTRAQAKRKSEETPDDLLT